MNAKVKNEWEYKNLLVLKRQNMQKQKQLQKKQQKLKNLTDVFFNYFVSKF